MSVHSKVILEKSQDSVHRPQLLKRKEARAESNRGPSVYNPNSLPLGQAGSHQHQETFLVVYLARIKFP